MYIVRHGQSVYNRDNIVSGHSDTSLTKHGGKQALETKNKLAGVHFDNVFSSDLKRAIQTAAIVFGKPVPKNQQLPQLRERNFGSIDGKSGMFLRQLHDEQKEAYEALSSDGRWKHKYAPDIESDHELSIRFMTALEKIALKHLGETILVVAHGGTLRTMLLKLGYGSTEDLPPGSFQNAGFVKLTFSDGQFKINKVDGVEK
jgi:broad specificity phosphatase PhoE